jgi:tetratricopeptide (TPR) repeat protein
MPWKMPEYAALLRFFTMTRMHVRLLRPALFALLLCGTAHANDLEQAQALFEQDRAAEAAQKVEIWLKAQPKDPNARFLKGLIHHRQGQLDEAVATFNALTKDFPHLPEPYNNLAVIHAGRGEYDKAIAALQAAIRTHPSYTTAHENLGDIYAKKAGEAYEQALNLDKKNKTVETKLAMLHGLFPQGAKPGKPPATAKVLVPAEHAAKPASPVTAAAISPVAEPVTPPPGPAVRLPPPEAHLQTPAAIPPAAPAAPAAEISRVVQAWADAWSSKDMARYLAAYADEFKPATGESRAIWAAQREQRIAGKPGTIAVVVEDIRASPADGGAVWASFRQIYRSGNMNERTSKRLLLALRGGEWKILREEIGAR